METIIHLAIAAVLGLPWAFAGGSIRWEDVKARISKTDPELVKVIETSFVIEGNGGGVRFGPQFGDRQGERISP